MSWYKTGTIAATNGSKIITGTGTQFTNPLNGVSAGRMLLLPAAGTVQIYEIESVQSDTQLTLVSAFTGTTGAGKAYAIPTSPAVSVEQFAHDFASTLAYYQQQLSGWQQILTGAGNVTLTTPDGQTITVRSQQAWDDALNGKLSAGDYGIGGAVPKAITQQGMHFSYSDTATAGTDLGIANNGVGYQSAYNTNRRGQIFQSFGDGQLRHRLSLSSTAADATSAWRVVWDNVNLVKQTSSRDITIGSVLTLASDNSGSFGLGSLAAPELGITTTLAAALATARSGLYRVPVGTAGSPNTAVGWYFLVTRYSVASAGVFAYSAEIGNQQMAQGNFNNGVFNGWVNTWNSANLVKQTSMYDRTTGAVLVDGAYGMGASSLVQQPAVNNLTISGKYHSKGGDDYGIPTDRSLYVDVTTLAANARHQFITDHAAGAARRIFSRISVNDIWQPPYEFWTNQNLVKQVNSIDTTTGRVLTLSGDTGSFGLGGTAVRMAVDSDVAAYLRSVPSGKYAILPTAAASNLPINGSLSGWTFETTRFNTNPLISVVARITDASGAIFHGLISGAGVSWFRVWDSANLVKQTQNSAANGDVLIAGLAGGIGRDYSQVLPDATLASDFRVNGVWYARTAQQSDVPNSGYLQNLFGNPSSAYGAQIWIDVRNSVPSFRYRTIENNAVAAWHELATLDTAQDITGLKRFNKNGEAFLLKPLVDTQSCFIRGQKADGSNHWYIGKGAANYTVAFSNQHSTAASSIALEEDGNVAIAIQTGKTARMIIGGASGRILSAGHNAVADANGFWKTASPVVKLFANGTSELTSEAEGITTERLSEGVYRISGCLGLNADRAWGGDDGGIDVPMCRNKLPRLWVDYGGDEGSEQINPDGSIVIRTYHRPHTDAPAFARNEIEGYANGDPIDIPHDTFISVRVQMPEAEVQEAVVETVANEVENDVVLETSTQA